jgi:LysM repeat protein
MEVGMTRKQVVFIIAVNAAISAVISLVVVFLVSGPPEEISSTTPSSVVAPTQPVAVAPALTPEVVIHIVKAGDTISGLALQYDVPVADIIAASHLENPNLLRVGMELVIPIGGLPQATATFTPEPTATETPIPFQPPSADMTATAAAELGATATSLPTPLPSGGELQIAISEILAPGQVEQERVIISNVGDQLADMQGWTLSDIDGNVYSFPNFRLWAGGSVTVHTRIGQDGNPPANFYWGKLQAVWSASEVATLKDAARAEISTYIVGSQ